MYRLRYTDKNFVENELRSMVTAIKASGAGKPYDCLIGVSGGTDSTYVAYLAKQLGLRPLAVHLDNGWDSELAVKNIENILTRLKIDLDTHVLDWNEFRDFQISFLRSSTPDAELPTDHAIMAFFNKTAKRYGIKYILNGRNLTTEGILPWSWTYSTLDWKYLKSVNKIFSGKPLKHFPHLNIANIIYDSLIYRIKNISILNYINYDKNAAMKILADELGWRDYGGKHYESIYTRFFQAYILPKKFNMDKRKAHYSVLVMTGQISRNKALELLQEPTFDPVKLIEDKNYVIKKLELSPEGFEEIMRLPVKTYSDYPNNDWFFHPDKNHFVRYMAGSLHRFGLAPKGLAENMVNKKYEMKA